MKVAIYHSFMDNIGGAEIVSLTLARELGADIYTTNISAEQITKMGFGDVIPRIISIAKVPKMAPFRHQLTLFTFRFFKPKKKYDYHIISGDWAMGAVVRNTPNMWYVHSPLNELWEFKSYIKKKVISSWKIIPYELFVMVNRFLTRRYARSVDKWVCNSHNTQNRIKKYYSQKATIIYPPIQTSHKAKSTFGNYWLSVNRLIKHKQIELQLKAFQKIPDERLVIVGSYEKGTAQFEQYKRYLESIQPSNVSIKHWVDNAELDKLYANCKGFITTAKNEDFGMTPLEAMSYGKSVVANNEGGYKESIIQKKTGILIDRITPDKIRDAVQKINENPSRYQKACLVQAKSFDTREFIKKIRNEIQLCETLNK